MNLNDRRKSEQSKPPEEKQSKNESQQKSENSTNTIGRLSQQSKDLIQKQSTAIEAQKKQIADLTEKIQKQSSEMQEMQSAITDLTTELSDTQKLNQKLQKSNQLLQQSNDDLRNNKGLKTRAEIEEITSRMATITADSKKVYEAYKEAQQQVNWSNVKAVQEAKEEARQARRRENNAVKASQEAQDQAEKKVEEANDKADSAVEKAKKRAEEATKIADARIKGANGYLTFIILLLILKSKTLRDDIVEVFAAFSDVLYEVSMPYPFWTSFAIEILVSAGIGLCILAGVLWYRTEWGRLTKSILIVSLSIIAVLPDSLRGLGITMNFVTFYFAIQGISLIVIKLLNVH